tara:strand:- start:375 stop:1073 length:699 start_codon:yes stop_codon:yes gene_type:complete
MSDKHPEQQPSYYAVIPASVRYCSNCTPNAKLLYGEIGALANKHGYCWATNGYFAKLYGISKPETISRWIAQLKKAGHISVEHQRNAQSEIVKRLIRINPLDEIINPPTDNSQDGVDEISRDNIQEEYKYIPFESFWSIYPRRENKKKAKITWEALKVDEVLMSKIAAHIEQRLTVGNWKSEPQYIPLPTTFLNGERWEDTITPKGNGNGKSKSSLRRSDVIQRITDRSWAE